MTKSAVTFVSQAALDDGIAGRFGLDKPLLAVRNTRGGISKASMIHNARDAEDRGRPGNLRGPRRRRAPDLPAGARSCRWRSATFCSRIAGRGTDDHRRKTDQAQIPGDALYDRDFVAWTEEQGKLLRAGKLDAIDLANLDRGDRKLGTVRQARNGQPAGPTAGAPSEMADPAGEGEAAAGAVPSRMRATRSPLFFEQSPSLRSTCPRSVGCRTTPGPGALPQRRRSSLSRAIPDEPPFTLDQILDDDFWPD